MADREGDVVAFVDHRRVTVAQIGYIQAPGDEDKLRWVVYREGGAVRHRGVFHDHIWRPDEPHSKIGQPLLTQAEADAVKPAMARDTFSAETQKTLRAHPESRTGRAGTVIFRDHMVPRAAANECMPYVQGYAIEPPMRLAAGRSGVHPSDPSPEMWAYLGRSNPARLMHYLEEVNPAAFPIFWAHHFDQEKLVDIAHQLGLSVPTVKWRHHQALTYLRERVAA